jgi:hypothetical protein
MRTRVFGSLTLHRFLMVQDVSMERSAAIFYGESVQVQTGMFETCRLRRLIHPKRRSYSVTVQKAQVLRNMAETKI